jgi:hypothetical protein
VPLLSQGENMSLKDNQPRRGHLREKNPNPKSDSTGRADGTEIGQKRRGNPVEPNPSEVSRGSLPFELKSRDHSTNERFGIRGVEKANDGVGGLKRAR